MGIVSILALILLLAVSLRPASAAEIVLDGGDHLYSQDARPVFHGQVRSSGDDSDATEVRVRLEPAEDADAATAGARTAEPATEHATPLRADGTFRLPWPDELSSGLYRVVVTAVRGEETVHETTATLRVQVPGQLPRKPLRAEEPRYRPMELPDVETWTATTDRWRLPLPEDAVAGFTGSKGKWDPYHQNKWKGDYPIHGEDKFLVLTGISDTLVDAFQVPTPSNVSANDPGDISFFGDEEQVLVQQLFLAGGEYYRGSTVFEPPEWRVRGMVALNGNYLDVEETGGVAPDVRDGTDRDDGFLALQELFYEHRLAVLSPHYDFLSVRVGIQPFNSDFRGFVFTDVNLGVRFFGNYDNNKLQYNLAYFDRLEKDTNSGLNTFEMRDQQVWVANLYRQDLRLGYTGQVSVHYLRDEATFLLDENGFLARPDPVGTAEPHEIEATYYGLAGFGHFGRLNIEHALYYVDGEDSLNPIAGRDVFGGQDHVDIESWMAALELSFDRDWFRPKATFFYASGDDDPTDRDAEGFAAIFENPNFAGGGFSFWNRLGVRLGGTAVSLINRGSLVPDLRSSKEEGQPNFVNPGILLLGLGLDVEVMPELRLVATANHLEFDTTEVLELLLFQGEVREEIGWDLSLGTEWRPFFHNQVIVTGGVAAFLPGDGFEDIYGEDVVDDALVGAFANVRLTF